MSPWIEGIIQAATFFISIGLTLYIYYLQNKFSKKLQISAQQTERTVAVVENLQREQKKLTENFLELQEGIAILELREKIGVIKDELNALGGHRHERSPHILLAHDASAVLYIYDKAPESLRKEYHILLCRAMNELGHHNEYQHQLATDISETISYLERRNKSELARTLKFVLAKCAMDKKAQSGATEARTFCQRFFSEDTSQRIIDLPRDAKDDLIYHTIGIQ